jgi:hypothetical protein
MIKKYLSLGLLAITTFDLAHADPQTTLTNSQSNSQTVVGQTPSQDGSTNATSPQAKYQAVIDDYRKYLSTVDKKTRDEIINFRKEMGDINKKKKDLYKSLSQEAQLLLEKEKAAKKGLPINMKKQITIQE